MTNIVSLIEFKRMLNRSYELQSDIIEYLDLVNNSIIIRVQSVHCKTVTITVTNKKTDKIVGIRIVDPDWRNIYLDSQILIASFNGNERLMPKIQHWVETGIW